jgi:hypothetical protein
MNPTGGQQQVQPGQDPITAPPSPTTTPFPTPDIYGREQRYFSPSYSKLTPEEAKKIYGFAAGGNVQLQGKVIMDDQGGGQFGQAGFGQQGANGYRAAGNGFAGNNNSAPQNQQGPFGGLDPRAIQANPQGFQNFMQGAQQREKQMPGSTFLGQQAPKQSYEDYLKSQSMYSVQPQTREQFEDQQNNLQLQRQQGMDMINRGNMSEIMAGLGRPQGGFGGGLQGGLGSLFGDMQQASSYADGGVTDEDRPTETPAVQAFKQMQAQRAGQPPVPQIDANAEFAKYAQQTVGAPNQLQAPTMPAPTSTNLADSGFSYNPVKQQYSQIAGTAPPEAEANSFSTEGRPVVAYTATGEKIYGEKPTARYGMGMGQNARSFASGGVSHLGDYSDGGRLLRGPGDGVSDSIPAMIGKKQPARLADGEFVVPARIVSELGNGSTEAGARKLYAMMDRVQSARGKTVGKGKVAKNSRSEKYLPA